MPSNLTPQIPIVFMGTPEFAATILTSLAEEHYRVVGVVTQPDKPSGRKQELLPSPVKTLALAHTIPVLQPQKLDGEAVEAIANLKPDLILVAAYGKILPEKLLKIPGMGCVNVHASLLPRWRGASPIQNALIAGDTTTGITLMLMDAGMDTGALIAQKSLAIEPKENAAELSTRLAMLGKDVVKEILPQWIKRKITPQPQDESQATLCQLIEREDGKVFWNLSAEEIFAHYRGLTPWPGLFTYWKNADNLLRLKLITLDYQKTNPQTTQPLGTVFEVGEKIGVQTGEGVIFLEAIQLEGKTTLPIREFLNGNPTFLGAELL